MTELLRDPYLACIALYLMALVGVGVYKARAIKDSEDFLVAGRTLPWYVLVGTLLATWMGSGSLFAGAGLGFRNGPSALWAAVGAWIGIVLVFFIARRVRNFGKVTIPEIFAARYGQVAATLAAITTVIAYLTIVSYQFKGGGMVLRIVTGGEIDVSTGIVITAVFAVLYTVLAGMLSVVYTDVVNGALMVIGCLATLTYMVWHVGGIDEVMATAEAAGRLDLFGHWASESASGASGPVIALSIGVPTMLLLLGDANMYQRIFSAKDGGSARKAILFWVLGVAMLESCICLIGLTGSVAAENGLMPEFTADFAVRGKLATEFIIPSIAMEVMPVALGMLLVATMMAVIVSTADSFLLIPATSLTRDVFQRLSARTIGERSLILISRLLVLALGAIAYLLVDQFPTVLDAAYTAYLVYGASITPALLAAFLWKRATSKGAVVSIVAGASVTLLWKFGLSGELMSEWSPILREPTFPAAGLSILSLIIVSLLTPKPPREALAPFEGASSRYSALTPKA